MADGDEPKTDPCRYKGDDPVALALSSAKEITAQSKEATDKVLSNISAFVRDCERRASACELDIGVLKALLIDVKNNSIERFTAQREAVSLALAAAKETTAIAQQTADRAVAKAEAAAGKEYLESQIEGLRESFTAQIVAQKEAINAALVAAKDALTAALASAEKAIAKAEQSNDKRFESVNEFRKTLGDQTVTFIARNEYSVQYNAIASRLTSLESRLDRGEGRSGISDPSVNSAISELKNEVRGLNKSTDISGGRTAAVKDNTTTFIAIGAVVVAVIVPILIRVLEGL